MRKLCITLALALPLLVVSGSPVKSWWGGRGWGYPGYGYGWVIGHIMVAGEVGVIQSMVAIMVAIHSIQVMGMVIGLVGEKNLWFHSTKVLPL